MATYTTQLRTIIEHYSQYETGLSHKEKLAKGIEAFFREIDYPIFSENYRKTFEENLVRHFYFREIGFETEYQFIFRLESWLKLHMPYYNRLFETETMKYDPLKNIEMSVKQDVSRKNTSDNTVTSTGERTGHQNTRQTTDANSKVDNVNEQTTASTSDGSNSNITTTDGTSSNTSTGKSTTDDTSTNKSVTSSDTTHNNAARKLYEDTPDGRLAITDDIRTDTINYATNIEENKQKDDTHVDSTTDDNGTSKSSTVTSSDDDGVTHSTSDSKGTTKDTTNTVTDGTSSSTSTDHTSTIGIGDSKENTIDKIIGNVTGNNNENLTNTRVGKEGTQTYQSMVMELRETFMRIERDIFKEMNKELFMLLY